MANFVPAGNVAAGGIAGTVALVIIHLMTANGIQVDQDASDGIMLLSGILTAYISDVISGKEKAATPSTPTKGD